MATTIPPFKRFKYHESPIVLELPTGDLGIQFSKTVPCEIHKIDESSPIFESSLQCLGRLAFYLSIPDKIDVYGALDRETLEKILRTYSDVPNRKIMFQNRGITIDTQGIVTATMLPTGPVKATFRRSRGIFAYRNRVLVKEAPSPDLNFEFPQGNYVEKVIIPNQVTLAGGVRTRDHLLQTLNHFAGVPGRRIVFQKEIPRGGVTTTITLPKGPIGVVFDEKLGLPIVRVVLEGSWAERLNIPCGHYVEKLIVPNKIAVERMECDGFEHLFNYFSDVEGRSIVLQEIRNDIPNAGATVTVCLPIGSLGITFRCAGGYITVGRVSESSPMKAMIAVGYVVERFVVPGEFELLGLDKMDALTFTETLKRFSTVPFRTLVLKQFRKDVQISSAEFEDILTK